MAQSASGAGSPVDELAALEKNLAALEKNLRDRISSIPSESEDALRDILSELDTMGDRLRAIDDDGGEGWGNIDHQIEALQEKLNETLSSYGGSSKSTSRQSSPSRGPEEQLPQLEPGTAASRHTTGAPRIPRSPSPISPHYPHPHPEPAPEPEDSGDLESESADGKQPLLNNVEVDKDKWLWHPWWPKCLQCECDEKDD